MTRFTKIIVAFGAILIVAIAAYLAWTVTQQGGIPGEIAESGRDVGTSEAEETPEVGITTESIEEIEQN